MRDCVLCDCVRVVRFNCDVMSSQNIAHTHTHSHTVTHHTPPTRHHVRGRDRHVVLVGVNNHASYERAWATTPLYWAWFLLPRQLLNKMAASSYPSSYRDYQTEARDLVQALMATCLKEIAEEVPVKGIRWPKGDQFTQENCMASIEELIQVKLL